jgi:hypothetical protein
MELGSITLDRKGSLTSLPPLDLWFARFICFNSLSSEDRATAARVSASISSGLIARVICFCLFPEDPDASEISIHGAFNDSPSLGLESFSTLDACAGAQEDIAKAPTIVAKIAALFHQV